MVRYRKWQLYQLTQNHQLIPTVEFSYVDKIHIVTIFSSGFRDFLVTDVEKLLIFSAWVEAVWFYFWADEFCHYSSSPPEHAGGNWKWVLFSASLVGSFAARSTNADTHTYIVLRASTQCSPSKSLAGILKKAFLWFYGATIWLSGEKKKIWKITFLKNTD